MQCIDFLIRALVSRSELLSDHRANSPPNPHSHSLNDVPQTDLNVLVPVWELAESHMQYISIIEP